MHRKLSKDEFLQEYGFSPVHDPGVYDKPAGCLGCPLYGNGKGFVPDEIRDDADTFILMQNPGATEEALGIPACGKTGQLLNKVYLPLAGLQRSTVSVGNVLKCRYNHTNNLPEGPILDTAVQHCTQHHLRIPDKATLVILQGALAYKYATLNQKAYNGSGKPATITSWRGYFLPSSNRPVYVDNGSEGSIPRVQSSTDNRHFYVTIHLADCLRDGTASWIAERDWTKIQDYRSGRYPSPYPTAYQFRAESTEGREFFGRAATGSYVVIDTEFCGHSPGVTGRLTICGLYSPVGAELQQCRQYVFPRKDEGCTTGIPATLQGDIRSLTAKEYADFATRLRELIRQVPVVFHNAVADIPVLEEAFGIKYEHYKSIEDTMLAHAILWSELPHDLEFLASYYGRHGKFKHLRDVDELRYNYGDVVDTAAVYEAMCAGFSRDTLAEKVYREQSLKLIPILLEARKKGIRVNKRRVLEVFNEYYRLAGQVERVAQAACGYAINLKSGDQIRDYLYNERRYPVQINKDTKRPSTDDDAIATLRKAVSEPFNPDREITLDRDDEKHYGILRRIESGADALLEARVLYAETFHVLNNYILGLCKGVYGEQNKAKKKRAREHYWKVGITLEDIVDRIYPNFAIHAQKTGRWSTTEPPLAQLPSALRDIICPDEDEVCFTWDWKAVEPRVLQALSGSRLLKKTFDENFDLHTWTVCYMFGYEYPADLVDPHKAPACAAWREKYNWKGGNDPRRVFAKSGRYEMWYGGSGSNAAQSAARFGLDPKLLKTALSRLLASDPDYYAWKVKTEAEIARTSLVRTFMGRPRRFLSKGDARRREGLDQPMQGAVSDLFNTTVVLLAAAFPFIRWGWGMHDSQKWYIKVKDLNTQLATEMAAIVERVHQIGTTATTFPGDFEIILPPESGGKEISLRDYLAGVPLPVSVEAEPLQTTQAISSECTVG